jgi:hypothetical protein
MVGDKGHPAILPGLRATRQGASTLTHHISQSRDSGPLHPDKGIVTFHRNNCFDCDPDILHHDIVVRFTGSTPLTELESEVSVDDADHARSD